MLGFFSKKIDPIKEQETLHNVDILLLDLLKKKEIKINKEEKFRERKKNEKGEALGTFKVVSYYDNLHYEYDGIIFPNIPVIKQNIESELRKQIASNNSKHKLSCFITIKYLIQVDNPEEKK